MESEFRDQAGDKKTPIVTNGGTTITVAQALIWTAKGYGRQAMAVSALAGLIVRPSTLSAITLYNNSDNKIYVIWRGLIHQLVSTAAQARFGLWLCSHPIGMTAPTNNNISIRNSTSGLAAGGLGIVDTAEAVTDNGWFPWGDSVDVEPSGSLPGAQKDVRINGLIIVPPTAGISTQVLASLAADTFTTGLHWFEVPESELKLG